MQITLNIAEYHHCQYAVTGARKLPFNGNKKWVSRH